MAKHVEGFSGALAAEQFTGGQSNPTLLLHPLQAIPLPGRRSLVDQVSEEDDETDLVVKAFPRFLVDGSLDVLRDDIKNRMAEDLTPS